MTKTITKEATPSSTSNLNIKDLQKLAEEAGYNLVKTPTLPILKEKIKRELLKYILFTSSYYNSYSDKLELFNAPIFRKALDYMISRLYEVLTYYEKYTEEYKNSLITKEVYNTRRNNIIKHIREYICSGKYTYNIPLKLFPETFILYLYSVTGVKPTTLYNFSIHTEIYSSISSPLWNIPYTYKTLEKLTKEKEETINKLYSGEEREKYLKRDIITKISYKLLHEVFPHTKSNNLFSDNYINTYSFIYSPEKKEEYFNYTSYINYFYISPTHTPIPRIKGLEYNIREISKQYRNPSYTISLEELRNYNTYSPILKKCETIHHSIQREIEEKLLGK